MQTSRASVEQSSRQPLTARDVIDLAARTEGASPLYCVPTPPASSPEAPLLVARPTAGWRACDEIDGGWVPVAAARVERPDRVGVGVGHTRSEALLAGMLDVVVRASRAAFERREPGLRIERPIVDPTDSSPLGHLVACAMANRLCVRVVQMHKWQFVPVAHCLVYDDDTRHLSFGSGAGGSLVEAIEHAIGDALSARGKSATVTRLRDGRGRWSNARSVHSLLDYASKQPRLRSAPPEPWQNDDELCDHLKSVLRDMGVMVLSVDLECPAPGLHAVRVIAPALTDPVPRWGRPPVDEDQLALAASSPADPR